MTKDGKQYCSPIGEDIYDSSGSCIAKVDLNKLIKSKTSLTNANLADLSSKDKIKLLQKEVKKRKLSNNSNQYCDIKKESCVINMLSPELYKKYFKPLMPLSWYNNPDKWLSNVDINNVLIQYENNLKNNFKLLDISPINYSDKINNFFSSQCVSDNLCSINKDSLEKLQKQRKWKLSIIFNTDIYGNPGKHWICIFVNINPNSKNYGIYYFDSNASFQSKYINEILNKLKTSTQELTGKDIRVYKNKIRVQKTTNTECGMFCLYMTINMLKNKSFHKLINSSLTDELAFKHREIFFNKL